MSVLSETLRGRGGRKRRVQFSGTGSSGGGDHWELGTDILEGGGITFRAKKDISHQTKQM